MPIGRKTSWAVRFGAAGGVIAVILVLIVIGIVLLAAWAVATGEQQSHEWQRQVHVAYRGAKIGDREATIRAALGDPAFVRRPHVQQADHCLIYRVLLTNSELVPYHLCYARHRLVSKYRGWDGVPADN